MLNEDHPADLRLEEVFSAMDARLNVRIRTRYFMPLLRFVERGHCYAIVDPMTARSYERFCLNGSALAFRPFSPPVHLIASIMTPAHRSVSHLVALFISELRDELAMIKKLYAPPE